MLLFASLASQVGPMIIIGFEGTRPSEPTVQKMINYAAHKKIGGIILFRRNIENYEQLKNLLGAFKKVNKKLLICVDQEGGKVTKIQNDFVSENALSENVLSRMTQDEIAAKEFPSAKVISELKESDAEKVYNKMADDLHKCGINVNFAPCVDVVPKSNNGISPAIGDYGRSYGEAPSIVIKNAKVFIKQHKKNGVLCCIKHFPGHGSATFDTHKESYDISEYFNEKVELRPFKALANSVPMVMVAHLINNKWDDKPATLSKKTIDKLKRFFNGVIVSDDLHMGGILKAYSVKDAVLMSVKAGNTMIILSNMPKAAVNIPDFKIDDELPNKIVEWISEECKKTKRLRNQIRGNYKKIIKLQKLLK